VTGLAIDVLLWGFVAALAVTAALRSRTMAWNGLYDGLIDCLRLVPRLIVGVVAAGFVAEVLPQNVVVSWLGPQSGIIGLTIATAAGALTPGGPMVGFAIAATGLKSGAGAPQIVAYVAAWSLFAMERTLMWELPVMSGRAVWVRIAVSLPLPFLAALIAMLVGKP
jgi:hypothetical protein